MNEHIIQTIELTKKYGNIKAVDNVSFGIRRGEIFGLLGPNGAGKTTIIKMLATLLKPTSGFAEVWHHNILKEQDAVRRSIGIVFQVFVHSVSLRKPTLEDVFLTFTGRTIREQEASVKEQNRMKAKASMRMGGKR